LESHLVGFDGNRDWSFGNGGQKLGGRVGLYGVDFSNVDCWRSLLEA
jgi:hypothetical protein